MCDNFVYDNAGVLSDSDLFELQDKLNTIENYTTNEIAVAVVNNLGNMNIKKFCKDVFSYNQLGSPLKNNGILILLSVKNKKTRIEVGYGFKNFISESTTGSIVSTAMLPYFMKQEYKDGFIAGIAAFTLLLGIISSFFWGKFTIPSDNRLALVFLPFIVWMGVYCVYQFCLHVRLQPAVSMALIFTFHLLFFWPYGAAQRVSNAMALPYEYRSSLVFLNENYRNRSNTLRT